MPASTSTVTASGATSTATRIEGTAAISVSGGGPGYDGAFTYLVDGFKQSDTPSTGQPAVAGQGRPGQTQR